MSKRQQDIIFAIRVASNLKYSIVIINPKDYDLIQEYLISEPDPVMISHGVVGYLNSCTICISDKIQHGKISINGQVSQIKIKEE